MYEWQIERPRKSRPRRRVLRALAVVAVLTAGVAGVASTSGPVAFSQPVGGPIKR